MTIDKHQLYGRFVKSWERREKLADLATRKALDLPMDDEMNITTTNRGVGLLPAAVVSAALLLAGGGMTLGLVKLLDRPQPAQVPASGSHVAAPPPSQEFKVTFWAEDGTPLKVDEQDGDGR